MNRPVVAVFKIENRGTALNLDLLTTYLASKLSKSGVYQVVPLDKLKQALRAKKVSYEQCYTQSCQIEVGKALAAEKVLATLVLKIGSKCIVKVALIAPKNGMTERAAIAENDCGDDEVKASIDIVVANLTRRP